MARSGDRRATWRRPLVAAVSVGGHLVALLAFVGAQPDATVAVEPEAMSISLVDPPPPPEPPKPPAPEPKPEPAPPAKSEAKVVKPAPPRPAPRKRPPARRTPTPPPQVQARVVAPFATGDGDAEVSEAEVASAATVGSGGSSGTGAGGGECDMARWLQAALRKDRRVQAAVAEVHRGKAIRVWNGDWVRHGTQEGAGLAAVRETIMWEVGFAPKACRTQPVRGLVVLSLNDGPGAARLVVGSDRWRWSDVLFARGGGTRR